MRVFLSYAESDRATAAKFRKMLEQAGMEVWFDEAEVLPGENWAEALAKALRSSDAMVTLLSPAAGKSPRVTREIEFAITQPRYRKRLIPVLVRPTRNYPWILQRLNLIDATEDPESGPGRVVEALKQTAALPR
jgi:TIR domain